MGSMNVRSWFLLKPFLFIGRNNFKEVKMPISRLHPDKDFLKSIFYYHDGQLYRKSTRKTAASPSKSNEHSKVSIYKYESEIYSHGCKYSKYRLHRLIWIYHNGDIPNGYVIHHKNMRKNDNRIENLEMLFFKDHNKTHTTEYRKKVGAKMKYGHKDE